MTPHSYETIVVSRADGVVTVTLNRPEKKNAINDAMWRDLRAALAEITASSADRVVVVRGAGGAFCSGADLSGSRSSVHPLFSMDEIHAIALALHHLPKPVVACVDGDAVGAGLNLALGCDIVLATPRSRFAEIFVRRGLSVDFGGSWLLPRIVGVQKAKLLCLTGDLISAAEAVELGLVTQLVDATELEQRLEDLTERLMAGAPVAQALTKRLLNDGSAVTMAQALDAESAAQAINLRSSDAQEARSAFLEKRPPVFEGK